MVYLRRCYECGYTTAKATTLCMHIAMKHGEKKKQCLICGERFASATQLHHHHANNHRAPYIKCPYEGCTELFKTRATMQIHYVRHHMDRKLLMTKTEHKNKSQCLSCASVFATNTCVYHVSKCSKLSPFHDGRLTIDELVEMSDSDEDMFCQPCEEPNENNSSIEQSPKKRKHDDAFSQEEEAQNYGEIVAVTGNYPELAVSDSESDSEFGNMLEKINIDNNIVNDDSDDSDGFDFLN